MYFASPPQWSHHAHAPSAFVVMFVGSASLIGALVAIDRLKNPPVDP